MKVRWTLIYRRKNKKHNNDAKKKRVQVKSVAQKRAIGVWNPEELVQRSKKIQEDNEKARQARIERAIKQRMESSRNSKHGKKQAAASGKKMSGAAQPNKKPDQVKGRASAKNFKTAK